jgi:hypothetical protein
MVHMPFEDELAWVPEAWDAYRSAPSKTRSALAMVMARIAEHPEDQFVRRRRMHNPVLFVANVPGEDWVVMWRLGEEVPEIHYVGRDPF